MEVENMGIDPKLFAHLKESYIESPFYQLLGLRVKSLAPGKAKIVVTTLKQHANSQGMVHGGLLMTAADSAMANAIRTLGIAVATVDCNISLLAAAEFGQDIWASGEVIKRGKNIIFTEARVECEQKLLAVAKACFFKTGIIEV